METPRLAPMTPEQLAAVRAGDGFAQLVDPSTNHIYFVTEPVTPTIDDEYVRAKLDEAQQSVDRGEVASWDVNEIRAAVRDRISRM